MTAMTTPPVLRRTNRNRSAPNVAATGVRAPMLPTRLPKWRLPQWWVWLPNHGPILTHRLTKPAESGLIAAAAGQTPGHRAGRFAG